MSSIETRNIVVLGGSIAGLSGAHYFLKHVLAPLKSKHPNATYRVYLVNPSDSFYWRIGAPRALVSEAALLESKLFYNIPDGFKSYPQDSFAFVQGTATLLDPAARTVTIEQSTRSTQTLSYHALLIATGAHTPSTALSPWKNVDETKKEPARLHNELPKAKTVIIGGGGPAGVETAGEIGAAFNGNPGFFTSEPKVKKVDIQLITADKKLLPVLRPAIAATAEKYLKKYGVSVKYNTKIEGHSNISDSKTEVRLSNGETLTCDVYIPATGVIPNTDFMPDSLLNERGYVINNATTLRVDAAGPRVYAVGDAGSYGGGGGMNIYEAVPVVMTNMKRDLLAYDPSSESNGEKAGLSPPAEGTVQKGDRPYKPNLTETQLVPIGGNGVGAIFGWKLPSFMVWLIKGRDYMASGVPSLVMGSKWNKESKWTPDA